MKDESSVPKNAIIIAGGEGTRLRPLTFVIPKPLVPLLGRPLIEYIIEDIARHGVKEVILAIGYKAGMVEEHFEKHKSGKMPLKIVYSIEKERLGTGGAVKLAMSKTHGAQDTIVMNGDNLFRINFAEMYRRHRANKAVVTIAVIRVDNVKGFGVLVMDGERITSFVEKPDPENAPSHYINCGIYIVSSRISEYFPDASAFSLERDVFEKLAPEGCIYAYPIEAFYTVNDHEQYKEMEQALREHRI